MAIAARLDLSPLAHAPDGEATRRAHDALKQDPLWTRLLLAGFFDAGAELYESRHCPACQSTLQRPVSLAAADRTLAEICGVAASAALAALSYRQRPAQTGRDGIPLHIDGDPMALGPTRTVGSAGPRRASVGAG